MLLLWKTANLTMNWPLSQWYDCIPHTHIPGDMCFLSWGTQNTTCYVSRPSNCKQNPFYLIGPSKTSFLLFCKNTIYGIISLNCLAKYFYHWFLAHKISACVHIVLTEVTDWGQHSQGNTHHWVIIFPLNLVICSPWCVFCVLCLVFSILFYCLVIPVLFAGGK